MRTQNKEADVHPAVIESTVLRIEGKVVSIWKGLVVNIGYGRGPHLRSILAASQLLAFSQSLCQEQIFRRDLYKCTSKSPSLIPNDQTTFRRSFDVMCRSPAWSLCWSCSKSYLLDITVTFLMVWFYTSGFRAQIKWICPNKTWTEFLGPSLGKFSKRKSGNCKVLCRMAGSSSPEESSVLGLSFWNFYRRIGSQSGRVLDPKLACLINTFTICRKLKNKIHVITVLKLVYGLHPRFFNLLSNCSEDSLRFSMWEHHS